MADSHRIPRDVQLIVFALLIVLIVSGNLLVVRLVYIRGQINVTKMFLIAISSSNILIGQTTISLEIYGLLTHDAITVVGCHFIIYFETTCFTANIYTIIVFIIDMYYTIVVKHRRTYSQTRVVVAVLTVWGLSLVFAAKSFIIVAVIDESGTKAYQNMKNPANTSEVTTQLSVLSDDNYTDTAFENALCSYLIENSQDDLFNRYIDLIVILLIPQTVYTVCLLKLRNQLWSREQWINTTLRHRRKLVKLLCGLLVVSITCWMPVTVSDIIIDTALLHVDPDTAEDLESSYALEVVRFLFVIMALCSLSFSAIFMICINDSVTSLFEVLTSCCTRCSKSKVHPDMIPGVNMCRTLATSYELFAGATGSLNNHVSN